MKWEERQKAYYRDLPHTRLQFDPDSTYAANIVDETFAAAGLQPGMRVLEVGAGSGRFTLHLVREGLSVTALDLSQEMLERLAVLARELEVGESELTLRTGSLYDAPSLVGSGFDAIVGFFLLHHLDDAQRGLEALRPLLKAGGELVFVEPNRLNPLFLIQMFACADMSWSAERGTYRYGGSGYAQLFRRAGFDDVSVKCFGFFPPQILDRARPLLGFEKMLAQVPIARHLLPLLLLRGTKPA
ncbi:MAG: 2-polyprenyl-6-hydroxyphenyl methylase / 3-demethylubiquinone-9 3-methyltransferase [Acidobacteriota bacterium]|nr:2-polyprenyl-6-hydroxyphenyl methylase / 3-demethylubiquinone-9 3-methyltransferase [Acidobacteriota bacterium]